MTSKSFFITFALIIGSLALTGCESVNNTMTGMKQSIGNIDMPSLNVFKAADKSEDESVPCPSIKVVDDLGFLHQYMEGNDQQPLNKLASVVISNINSTCFVKNNTLIVDLEIAFSAGLGQAAQKWKMSAVSFAYPYFLAISAADDTIIAKEIFQLSLTFEKDESGIFKNVSHIENIRQIIPLDGPYMPEERKFMVGFQLSEEQLQHNQALLRKDSGTQVPLAITPASATAPETKTKAQQDALSKAALMAPPLPLFKPPYEIPDAPTTQNVKAAPAPYVEETDVTEETPQTADSVTEIEAKSNDTTDIPDESSLDPVFEEVIAPDPQAQDVTPVQTGEETIQKTEEHIIEESPVNEESIPDFDFYEYGDDEAAPAPPALP